MRIAKLWPRRDRALADAADGLQSFGEGDIIKLQLDTRSDTMDGEGQTLATTKATPTVFQPLTPNLTQPLALSPSPSPKHLTPTPTRTKALLTIDPKLPTAYLLLTTHYLLPTTKAMLTVYKNGQEHTGYDNVPVRHVVTLSTVRLLQRTVRSVVVNASPSPKPNVLTGRLALCGGRARRRCIRDCSPRKVRHPVRGVI